MTPRTVSAVIAALLLAAYFAPLVIKLRELPLAVVIALGLAFALHDVWRELKGGE